MPHLSLHNLEFWYENRRVFTDLNASLQSGCHLLFAPNGYGKSTLLKILAGMQDPDKGFIQLDDVSYPNFYPSPTRWQRFKRGLTQSQHLKHYVQQVAFSPDKLNFLPNTKLEEFIELTEHARMLRKDITSQQLLDEFGLQRFQGVRLSELSLGTAKKLMHLCTLIIDAKLYLFDEPCNGLDKQSRTSFLNHLKEIDNKIVIIATHRPQDYQSLTSDFLQITNWIAPPELSVP